MQREGGRSGPSQRFASTRNQHTAPDNGEKGYHVGPTKHSRERLGRSAARRYRRWSFPGESKVDGSRLRPLAFLWDVGGAPILSESASCGGNADSVAPIGGARHQALLGDLDGEGRVRLLMCRANEVVTPPRR